jgi:AbrB family looped-hinge helix DNA binding protein
MMRAQVSEKGQVTIPKTVRKKLGLVPGSVIDFRAENGLLVGAKASPAEDPVLAVTGIVDLPETVDRYLLRTRGPVR